MGQQSSLTLNELDGAWGNCQLNSSDVHGFAPENGGFAPENGGFAPENGGLED